MSLFTTDHSLLGAWLPSLETDRELQIKQCFLQATSHPGFGSPEADTEEELWAFFFPPGDWQWRQQTDSSELRKQTMKCLPSHTEPWNEWSPPRRMGYAPRPAVLVGHGVLLHDGRETEQREALEQVQLAGCLSADVGWRCRWLWLVWELEAVPPESPLPERPSEKPITKGMGLSENMGCYRFLSS